MHTLRRVDRATGTENNAGVPRPEVARRVKSYSAATGYTFQYAFQEVRKARRGFSSGNEYIYRVSADRKTAFPVFIFVRHDAARGWGRKSGRELNGTEEYAVAKMRLFQALDEVEDFAAERPELQVDDSNLEALLERLDL
jgi:hypothetical protein